MPAKTFTIYIPPWIILFIIFAAISAYLFVLSAHLDPDDPNDQEQKIWVKWNYGAAAAVALFAIISIPWGILHQRKLKQNGWKNGKSPQEQANELAGQAAKFNAMQPKAAPQLIQMVPQYVAAQPAPGQTS